MIKDGRAIYSCTALAIDVQGSKITTIEGLGTPDNLSPVQAAFVHNDAQQCGFCTPGFVVACTAMLKSHANPTRRTGAAGAGRQPLPLRHVCGHQGSNRRGRQNSVQWPDGRRGRQIMTSINWPPKEKLKLIGTRIDRLDGPAKSSGAAKYSLDIQRPGLLYGKILGSPIAAGTLKSLDTKAAEALKGVEAVHVMTEPGKPINWAGQEIVAIAAETEEIATEAIRLVKAEYERGKPQVDDTDPAKGEGDPRTRTDGDPEKAFAEAAATVSGRYGVAAITHCCLEPHGQVSEFRDGELHVWPSTQNVSGYRRPVDAGRRAWKPTRFTSIASTWAAASVRSSAPMLGAPPVSSWRKRPASR